MGLTTYAGLTYPYTTTGMVHHLGKREAEAEPEADADALLPYAYNAGVLPYTAGVLPYAHHTYAQTYVKPTVAYTKPLVTYKAPLTTYAGLTYPGYTGYAGIHHLGKREAEAEPEADSQVLLNTPYT